MHPGGTSDRSDLDLVASARRGSQGAYGELVARHQQAVRGFLRRMRADPADADDAAQDAFVAGWQAIGRFDGRASFRSWICAIAWRKLRDQRRSDGRRRGREAAVSDPEAAHRETHDARLDAIRLLGSLPPDQRAVAALCLAGDFSHAEASAALGLPLGTVKSHALRGRARMLQLMDELP